jgi:hypothetical protein
MEYEGIVDKLHRWQFLCAHHQLERFNPLTYRGGTRAGEAAHTPKPVAINAAATGGSSSRLMGSGMPDSGFE